MTTKLESLDILESCGFFKLQLPVESIILLPRNFDCLEAGTELFWEDTTTTVQKLIAASGVSCKKAVSPSTKILTIHERHDLTTLPTILITLAVAQQNPQALSVVLNVLSNYIFEVLRGKPSTAEVQTELLIEETPYTYRFKYRGDGSDLSEIPAIIKAARKK